MSQFLFHLALKFVYFLHQIPCRLLRVGQLSLCDNQLNLSFVQLNSGNC